MPHSLRRRFLAAVLVLATTTPMAQTTVEEEIHGTPSAGAMALDLVVVRPVSLAATVLGTGLYIVSLPFAALSGDVVSPAQRLIVEPAKYTFTRPLGESAD